MKHRVNIFLVATIYLFSMLVSILPTDVARADSLLNYSGGDISGLVEDVISISGITVSGDSLSVPLSISVDSGVLYMERTDGLNFNSGSRGSSLSFSGSTDDINAALATLKYRNVYATTVQITVASLAQGEVFFPGNGHLYEIANMNYTWEDAKFDASNKTKYGVSGYLATITTQEENDYVKSRLVGDGWFGASDSEEEGVWKWVTGPEAGTTFWTGQGDGSPVDGRYSNWANGEPNDYGDGEDCAQFYAGDSGWNDLPCNGHTISSFVVEYGSPDALPEVEFINFNVTTNYKTGEVENISSCDDLLAIMEDSNDSEGTGRYDTLRLTQNIDCAGKTVESLFRNYEDQDFGRLGFRGIFEGQGYSISNLTIAENGRNSVGLFAHTNNATITDLILESGNISGDSCVGALAGSVRNSIVRRVTNTNASLNSLYGKVGGLVGCYTAEGPTSSFVENNMVSANVVSDGDSNGGIVGYLVTLGTSNLTISGNNFNGVLDSEDSSGGIVGEIQSNDDSTLSIEDNTSIGVLLPGDDQIGGIVGYINADDKSVANIRRNTVTSIIVGAENVGGIVGSSSRDSSSARVIISANLEGVIVEGSGHRVGGILGQNSGTEVIDSSFNGTVNGASRVGGLVGANGGSIINSWSSATVTGEDNVGGLAGRCGGGIASSYSLGNVNGDSKVGGLVGVSSSCEITESYSSGLVEASGNYIGGLIGEQSGGQISESFATGIVTGDDQVGGFVGVNYGGNIINSFARGVVNSEGSEVGGFSGACYRDIEKSYSTGLVENGGGFTGNSYEGCDTDSSFWDMNTSKTEESGGATGKSTLELKIQLTFTDTETEGLDNAWDFDNVWSINRKINNGYPCLQWFDGCDISSREDVDIDSITDAEEDAAPNAGDANNDGIKDSEQPYVSSFLNPITNTYASIELDDDCSITNAITEEESNNSVLDSGFNYSAGLLNFTAECGIPGYETEVKIYQYGLTESNFEIRKFNPNSSAYFNISNANYETKSIDGNAVIIASFIIIDGQELDIDGTANGTIVDPVGFATPAVGVPNTGLGGLR